MHALPPSVITVIPVYHVTSNFSQAVSVILDRYKDGIGWQHPQSIEKPKYGLHVGIRDREV